MMLRAVASALSVRWSACLQLIVMAEKNRSATYTWVVRTRPDIAIRPPCHLSAASLRRDTVWYAWDYVAAMPRAAAAVSLSQVPLARRLNASVCFEHVAASKRSMNHLSEQRVEYCNPCLLQLHGGWKTAWIDTPQGGEPTFYCTKSEADVRKLALAPSKGACPFNLRPVVFYDTLARPAGGSKYTSKGAEAAVKRGELDNLCFRGGKA